MLQVLVGIAHIDYWKPILLLTGEITITDQTQLLYKDIKILSKINERG